MAEPQEATSAEGRSGSDDAEVERASKRCLFRPGSRVESQLAGFVIGESRLQPAPPVGIRFCESPDPAAVSTNPGLYPHVVSALDKLDVKVGIDHEEHATVSTVFDEPFRMVLRAPQVLSLDIEEFNKHVNAAYNTAQEGEYGEADALLALHAKYAKAASAYLRAISMQRHASLLKRKR